MTATTAVNRATRRANAGGGRAVGRIALYALLIIMAVIGPGLSFT